ncbi:MAG: GNAT family N-acetyltransferase, partial [Actinomycetota bacterium]|nr:GNAT family N-acetyltransferase [Actinomycetota bacterium]
MIAPDAHAAVVAALEANQWELFRSIAVRGGAEVQDDAEVLWWVTGVRAAPFNGVLRATLAPERADAAIDEVAAVLDSRGSPWAWYVGPASLPLDLADRLRARGFRVLDTLPGMAAPLAGAEPPTPELRYEQVREEPSLEAFGTLLGLAFEMPPLVVEPFLRMLDVAGKAASPDIRNYIALDDGEPVACGTVVLAAGVAGFYNIGVLPDRQGQGIGTAMTAALIGEAAAAGAETAVLWSSAAGVRCYRALGFEER